MLACKLFKKKMLILNSGGIYEGDDSCEISYMGPLCNSCSGNYFKDPIYDICVLCWSVIVSAVGILGFFITYIAFYTYMIGFIKM